MRYVFIALVALVVASPAWATKPNPEHKVTICHATPPDTAANGWVSINVDVASVGYQNSGHEDQHDADIIPAYTYTDVDGNVFVYEGKNLTTDFSGHTGAEILANGCESPDDNTTGETSTTTTTNGNSTTTGDDDNSTTTGHHTTGTPQVNSTTGGTTSTTTSELPFTGLPIWIPLLSAASLIASGIWQLRRSKAKSN